MKKEKENKAIKLNYSLKTPEERVELVKEIINNADPEQLTSRYLEILSNYIIFAMSKEEKKKKEILTDNRMITINRREISFEGVSEKIGNGEDGIYNLISDLGKITLLTHKDSITNDDLKEIPELVDMYEAIEQVEKQYEKASGKKKYLLKKQLIEMHQDLYVIRNNFKGGANRKISYNKINSTAFSASHLIFDDKFYFDERGNPKNDGLISFFNPKHIEALLCNYSELKQAAYGDFEHDLWYVMEDLDEIVDKALKEKFPLYYDLLIYKIDGKTNLEIQFLLERDYEIRYTVEYLSSLWRKKIPKMVAEKAQEEFLINYYKKYRPFQWKICSRCGTVKPAHNRFFSRNKSSKDGWYSMCKECRNAKSKKNQKLIEIRKKRGC